MPIFEVQSANGTFQIDAPDQQSALGALSQMPAHEDSLAGSAKALGVGVGRGAIGLAGLPADIADLASRGLDAVAGTKTNDSGFMQETKKLGSENIKRTVEGYTGKFYEPQTTAEKYLTTVGEFAPAMIGGPGSLLTRAATRTVIPGIASEAAGQLAEGTAFEPVARIAGGLTGAVGANAAAQRLARPGAAPVPTTAQNTAATTAGYQHPAVQALEIDAGGANRFVDRTIQALQRDRFSEKQAGQTYDLLNNLRVPEYGVTHKIQDFDATRRLLNTIAGSGGTEGEAARRAVRAIDSYTLRVPQADVIAGDARAAGRALFDARATAAAGFRSERVNQILERAYNTASATHSGGNLENEIYKQIRTMLNNPRRDLRGWTQAERDELRAVLPDLSRSVLRRVAKVLGGGGGLGQLASSSAGAAMFGPVGMFGLPAAGMAANAAGSRIAVSRLRQLEESLRARAPSYAAHYAARQRALAGPTMGQLAPSRQLVLQALVSAQSPNALSYQPR